MLNVCFRGQPAWWKSDRQCHVRADAKLQDGGTQTGRGFYSDPCWDINDVPNVGWHNGSSADNIQWQPTPDFKMTTHKPVKILTETLFEISALFQMSTCVFPMSTDAVIWSSIVSTNLENISLAFWTLLISQRGPKQGPVCSWNYWGSFAATVAARGYGETT